LQLLEPRFLLVNSGAASHGLATAVACASRGRPHERHAGTQTLVDAIAPRTCEREILSRVVELFGFALQTLEVALLRARQTVEVVAAEFRETVFRICQASSVVALFALQKAADVLGPCRGRAVSVLDENVQ